MLSREEAFFEKKTLIWYKRGDMRKFILVMILLCVPFFLFGQEVLEKIEIIGNEKVTRETILYYLASREGDYFNRDLLRRDFRILWSTGFFSDIKMEEELGDRGKVIKIIVEENPIIKSIIYKTGKKLKKDEIEEKLKEKDVYVLPFSYYSPHRIQKIESTIRELLLEKGLTQGTVTTETNTLDKNEMEIVFRINEGPKIRIGEIVFEGNPKLSSSTLMSALKENRKHSFISWISGKDTFKQNRLSEDLVSLKRKLQENGFMEATIGEPRTEEITKKSIFFRKQKMKKLIIPVNAGYRYFVGEVKIEGNQVFNSEALRNMIHYSEGDIYSIKVREKAIEEIGELYQNFGYLYSRVMPVESLDPKRKRVNVTFNVFEGEIAYLHRLEFKGNVYTKDKVIRREMLLREGDRFSFALFKDSILRMKQLGLVELEKDPDIQPNPEDPTQINVSMEVKELQRNNIQFTAGYSGYQGTFVALSYSTVNFLGAGENLELSFQYGKRIRNYSFGFTEPYFLDLPISLGFNVFDRYNSYPFLFTQKSKGINFNFGARIKGYWRSNLTYGFEYIEMGEAAEEDEDYLDYYGYGGYGGYGGYNPYLYGGGGYGTGKYAVSSISTTLFRNTVDSPLTPTKGTTYLASAKFAGSFLGGDVTMIKPRFEWTLYRPLYKRSHVIGFHLEYQFLKTMGGSPVPYWEKFYLGGERSIRGYDIYTIGPRTEDGRNIGGEKSFVFNAEYIITVGGPLFLVFFYDAGNSYLQDQKFNFRKLYISRGMELRIFVPALRVPFRLIFSYNSHTIRAGDSKFAFRFAIGTTF